MYDLDNGEPGTNATQLAYVDQFQAATLALFASLPPTVAIFSSACAIHCLSGNADFYTFMVDGISMMQGAIRSTNAEPLALRSGRVFARMFLAAHRSGLSSFSGLNVWFFGGDSTFRNIEPCTGYACTYQCQGGPWMPTNQACPSDVGGCGTMGPVEGNSVQAALAFYQSQHNGESQPEGVSSVPVPASAQPPPLAEAEAQGAELWWSKTHGAAAADDHYTPVTAAQAADTPTVSTKAPLSSDQAKNLGAFVSGQQQQQQQNQQQNQAGSARRRLLQPRGCCGNEAGW